MTCNTNLSDSQMTQINLKKKKSSLWKVRCMNYHMELSHESDVQLFFLDFMKLILCPFHLLPQKIEKESDCHFSPQKF